MRDRNVIVVLALLTGISGSLAVPAGAGDIALDPALTTGEFRQLALHLAEAMDPPAGPSPALGLLGLEIEAGVAWVPVDAGAGWWRRALAGASRTAGGVAAARASIRKGLPLGVDVGATAGRVVGLRYHGLETRVALVRGGMMTPAVALRAAWSELGSGPVDLSVVTVAVAVSKGVGPLVPYGSLGIRRWSAGAAWGDPEPVRRREEGTSPVASAGFALRLPLLSLRLEVRRGEATAAFAGAGVRF